MGLFDFGKKKDKRVIDLTERYWKQQERTENMKREMQQNNSDSGEMFSIFGGATPTIDQTNLETDSESPSASPEERRRRLTKRLLDMTNKIEELSNQIYHLTQRIEVLERKVRVKEVE